MQLNSLLSSCQERHPIESCRFPLSQKELPRPVPEDFSMRGLLWVEKYFPTNWLNSDKMEDDKKHFEVPPVAGDRKERLLWLGIQILSHFPWLLCDETGQIETKAGEACHSYTTSFDLSPPLQQAVDSVYSAITTKIKSYWCTVIDSSALSASRARNVVTRARSYTKNDVFPYNAKVFI
jgi:hypothetical protein